MADSGTKLNIILESTKDHLNPFIYFFYLQYDFHV